MEADLRSPQAMAWMSLGVGVCMGLLMSRARIFRTIFPVNPESAQAVSEPVVKKGKLEPFAKSKEKFKVVFAVREDLKMGAGKVAAQCGHAAVEIYKAALKKCPLTLKRWERCGQQKVVLKISSEQEMERLELLAEEKGLVSTIIYDAGHTQVEAGSATVLGIGPGPDSVVNTVTGHLKLY